MGQAKQHLPVLLVTAMFARDQNELDTGQAALTAKYGPVEFQSEDLPFDQTSFYQEEMGQDLIKRFLAFRQLIPPEELPKIKLMTNQIESDRSVRQAGTAVRAINLDPGYVTEAKLVLATTKDRDHRIWLSDGIYGEITLYFQRDGWKYSRWTYPDYRTETVLEFVEKCRLYLRDRYKNEFRGKSSD